MKYQNYIFDLYGTLIHIRTDEWSKTFWKKLAAYYACFGADYEPEKLHEAYDLEIRMEEKRIIQSFASSGIDCTYPEVDLAQIFVVLFLKAPHRHFSEVGEGLLSEYKHCNGDLLKLPALKTWALDAAHFFRITSRKRFGLYPGTLKTLKTLKKEGCGIYLLSNAQRSFTMSEMEVLNLPGLFDGIYISSDKQMKKPQPDFLQNLLKEYKLDPKTSVMVGNDFGSDIGIARACDMDSVYLNTDHLTEKEIQLRSKEAKKQGTGKITVFPDGKIYHLTDM